MILFALTVTDFYLTMGLIDVVGVEVEANLFMRSMFDAHPSGMFALGFKFVTIGSLYYVLQSYDDKPFEKFVLILAVLLYTGIILYSLVLTYFDELYQIKQTLFN